MALITEDGTAKADAESYITLADATAHHAAMGNAAWAALATDDLREQALRRAASYMVQIYRPLWAGYRKTSTQALDWPRYSVPAQDLAVIGTAGYYADDVVPAEVRKACAELALRAAAGTLLADESREVVEQTVGPITTKYRPGSGQAKRYPAIDGLLSGLLSTPRAGVAMRLVRA